MTVYDTYGTSTHTATELTELVADQLGLSFVEHHSYYRGIYFRADVPPHQIEVQPNAIPGDDGQHDLYCPEPPEIQTLLLVTSPDRDSSLKRRPQLHRRSRATGPGDNLKTHRSTTIDNCSVYGKKKQWAGFGHAKVGGYQVLLRGLNALVATISTPLAAPVIAATQLRGGSTSSARGAAHLAAEAIVTAKPVLAEQGPAGSVIVLRGDSAFYSRKVITACRRAQVRFSVTIRVDKKVKRSIQAIPADAWVEIEYPQPVWDEQQQRFVSRAHIAETPYIAFEGTRDEVTARLIVRRIPDLNRTGLHGQGELFPVWRYHAAFTDSPLVLVQAEEHHRGHAIIEQVFAELINGPLAHLPSGPFDANNAWLALTATAHNLTRAAATLAAPRYASAA